MTAAFPRLRTCRARPALVLLLAGATLAACGRPADHSQDGHEAEPWAVTAWTDAHEIFAEIEPLVAGQPASSNTHVTVLADFSPLREGEVSAVLRGPAGEAVFTQAKPRRDGIFVINPEHLVYDPRTLDIGEYLEKPDHNFARGQSAQFNVAPELKGTMRRCDSCHEASKGHSDWLPYIDKHMETVACETCHIPQLYAPAIQSYDWTVLTPDKEPVKVYRGVEGDPSQITSLVTGYQPVLLNRNNIDGEKLLAPYNLITTYYWIYEDANGNTRPVRLFDLESVYFENRVYAADILSAFDANNNGTLDSTELRIDSSAKEDAVKAKLVALGLTNPRIFLHWLL